MPVELQDILVWHLTPPRIKMWMRLVNQIEDALLCRNRFRCGSNRVATSKNEQSPSQKTGSGTLPNCHPRAETAQPIGACGRDDEIEGSDSASRTHSGQIPPP